jgi:1-phosphofructokinase
MRSSDGSTSPHVFTLTGNLLAERTLDFDRWAPGETQRARRESFQVGGKGINVSKMLNRLGSPNTALCFVGGASGTECQSWLERRGFRFRTFATSTATRTGTVVHDGSGSQRETTFLGADAAPDAAALRALAEFLDAQPPAQTLALCGSFPGWADPDFDVLRAAVIRWMQRGSVVADSYGPALSWLMTQPLDLIKLNASELRASGLTEGQALPPTVKQWVVTDGPRPVRVSAGLGQERQLTPPTLREVSPTGSGDVLFACVLHALLERRMSLLDAVAFGIPYAAANAAHPGVAEFDLPKFGGISTARSNR